MNKARKLDQTID